MPLLSQLHHEIIILEYFPYTIPYVERINFLTTYIIFISIGLLVLEIKQFKPKCCTREILGVTTSGHWQLSQIAAIQMGQAGSISRYQKTPFSLGRLEFSPDLEKTLQYLFLSKYTPKNQQGGNISKKCYGFCLTFMRMVIKCV